MAAVYVASMGDASGKSDFCAVLAKKLQANGKNVGFLMPISIDPGANDKDVHFMKQVLGLDEPVTLLRPVSITADNLKNTLGEEDPSWLREVKNACAKVSEGKDAVVMEGFSGFRAGSDSAKAAARIADAIGAKIMLLVPYEPELKADRIIAAARVVGDSILGIVINGVPEGEIDAIKEKTVAVLEGNDIKVLGILPEGLSLFTASISELVEHVGGSILNSEEHTGDLVESLMVGALSQDSGLSYLSLKNNKAVVTRGDHADIQLAALNTSTRCLVLTENIQPLPAVLSRARELGVPIVVVEKDTVGTIEALQGAMGVAGFYNEEKLEKMMQVFQENIDLDTIIQIAQTNVEPAPEQASE